MLAYSVHSVVMRLEEQLMLGEQAHFVASLLVERARLDQAPTRLHEAWKKSALGMHGCEKPTYSRTICTGILHKAHFVAPDSGPGEMKG